VRIGLLWRAEWDPVESAANVADSCKLRGMFAALSALGVQPEPVVYSDEAAGEVRDHVFGLDGVLVWVNPIEQGLDRSRLDPLLREASRAGVWVSAHPDVILRMGTKEVLVDTRHMEWGTETRLYRTLSELREELPSRLAAGSALVLKQYRGMGGDGVWKVEQEPESRSASSRGIRVQHAARGSGPELVSLDDFIDLCRPYFLHGGLMVEQPYQDRLAEGMIRAYLSHAEVVGFAHQYPRGLMPPGEDNRPTTKEFEAATTPSYRRLRAKLEADWVPELQRVLGLETHELPAIWDADFLFGPKTASGEDSYVLCEINVSSTFAFPEFAMPKVAQAAVDCVRSLQGRSVVAGSD
jgi:hypothetical protein